MRMGGNGPILIITLRVGKQGLVWRDRLATHISRLISQTRSQTYKGRFIFSLD